ncbi:MAG: RNA-guided endonuclease InsQ/TnpB family protein [Nitrososphaerales archaeon]
MSSNLLLNETCKFKLNPNEEHKTILEELFSTYENIVKECLNKSIVIGITSRKRLHEAIYEELRAKYSFHPSHYIYTAITQALGIFKSFRRLSRKRRNVKAPSVENLNTILLDDTHLFWFNWGSLKLATHKGHIIIPFELHEHSRKFSGWSVKGSRLVRKGDKYFLHITFRKVTGKEEPSGVLGIDINEKSIDLAIVKLNKVRFIKIDVSETKYIRDRYFKKRRSIQTKTSGKIKTKLLTKYSGREKRRINDILHRASKIIAKIISEENLQPAMENLRHIRERINYGRKTNRRLHNMPFRKLQSFISYKAIEQGYKPEYVDAKNTSKTCPICGEINKPNGHVYKCKRCGFQADRHIVAAWNIAVKLPMWGVLPLPLKAIDEAFKAEVERMVIKC